MYVIANNIPLSVWKQYIQFTLKYVLFLDVFLAYLPFIWWDSR